jgi:hypothetical protein
MKILCENEIEALTGGSAVGNFCMGFGAVAAVYEAGVLANIWNPVGWTAAAVGGVITLGCVVHAFM